MKRRFELPSDFAEKGGESRRAERFGDLLRSELMTLIIRGEVRNPLLEGLVITQVSLSPDLSVARINVVHDKTSQKEALKALKSATPYLRKKLSESVNHWKRLPELRFAWDTGTDATRRVHQLLDEIQAQNAPTKSPDGPNGSPSVDPVDSTDEQE